MVIDFGTNRKRVCDFLLIRHSNPGPILHLFGDIAAGALKMQDVKMTDVKLTDQFAGHEIAGHENAGMK